MNQSERDLKIEDLMSIPTAVTTAGFWAVLKGSGEINTMKGAFEIAGGRAADILDGFLARKLHQESDAGALADAAADKLGLLAISVSAIKNKAVPPLVIGTILAKNAASAGLSALAARNHPDKTFRPSQEGKLSMATDTITLIANIGANAIRNERPELVKTERTLRGIGHLALVAGLAFGTKAIYDYTKRARKAA